MVEDGKAIYAYDRAQNVAPRPSTEYFLRAVEAVKQNKQHYAVAQAQALMQPKSSMPSFFRSFISSENFKVDADDD